MRELKDYFCTYEQSLALKELGYLSDENVLAFYASFYETQTPDLKFEYEDEFDNFDIIQPSSLRSQALDFFRELGWSGYVRDYTAERHVYCINKITQDYVIKACKHMQVIIPPHVKNSHEDKKVVEANLISKLIELEKEARNGN